MSDMERSPRLDPQQLPKDKRIPKDTLLRGASPEEVAGTIRAWLANECPPYRGIMVTLARDQEGISRVEQRWKRLCRANNINQQLANIDSSDRAITAFGEIVLMPEVVAELSSSSIYTRSIGARTLFHEWWHICRLESKRFYSFEEGTADVFADLMYQRAFGKSSPPVRTYEQLANAIDLISKDTGVDNWYLASRAEKSVTLWLSQFLTEIGYEKNAINDVLEYTPDDGTWLIRVKRMIVTREEKQ